ncbi:hypothetical protein [Streptomyces sp. C]|uniref:hypothetical protein n=1 Tax=Streptomyces sp. C TaxID=253839 RepID=UPI0001B53C67|nr:hypothetical protein [Streptomyces sp. C]
MTAQPYRSKPVVGETFEAEKAQIEADMREAQSLPIDEYCGFLGDYGRVLRNMADAYQSPDVAYGILLRHSDAVLDRIADEADAEKPGA